MFKKAKIGFKLISGFLLVAFIAAVIGIFASINIKIADDSDTKLYEKMTVPLSDLIYIAESFQRIRVNMRDLLRTTDETKNKYYEERIAYFQGIITEHEKPFVKTILTAEGQKIYDNYKTSKDEFYKSLEEVVKLGIANKNEEAIQIMDGVGKTAADKVVENIDVLIVLKIKLAKETSELNSKNANTAIITMISIIVLGVLISILLGVFLSTSISRPIGVATDLSTSISEGDLDLIVPDKYMKRGDEIGNLAKSFDKMISDLKYKSNLIEKISEGDLTVEIKAASEKDKLGKSLIIMTDSLNDILGQVNSSVEQISSGSGQVSEASQSLSQGATEQASSLEEITSSVNEINSQAKLNSENAGQANTMAKQAMEGAAVGNNQMRELVLAMADINKSADGIKKIAKAIDDIAFQINLLALNANVEAARAGKYGKGFAVVADEVRNLAVRSGNSVKEATELVDEAIRNITNGNKLVEVTAKQIEEIVGIAGKVADIAAEVTVASKEQTQGLDQINQGLGQIDQVTQANTASAEETASAAEELAGQSEQLKGMIAKFKLRNKKLLTENSGVSNELMAMLKKQIRDEMHGNTKPKINTAHEFKAIPPPKKKENKPEFEIADPKNIIKLDDNDFGNF